MLTTIPLLLLVLVVATFARWFIWPSMDQPVSADAVVVFAGGIDGDRVDAAERLMRDEVAPVLVISTGNDQWRRSDSLNRLCSVGSPDFDVICIQPEPDTTIGEAVAFAEVSEARGFEDLVVVSSEWHLHRSNRWLQRCFDGTTQVVGAPTPRSLDIISHEIAGTLHALILDRSCPDGDNDPVIAEFDRWSVESQDSDEGAQDAGPTLDGNPDGNLDDEPTMVERRPRDATRTECQDWVGRRWLMTVYSVPVEHPDTRTVADLAKEGFTHVGPWYEDDRWESAPEAARLGLCTVFPVGRSISADEALADLDGTLSALAADVARAVADPELNDSISMWSLLPEELNIYRDGHQELLEAMADVVRAGDPLQRPLYSYLQSNADERQFETASSLLDVLGHGNYLSTNGLADQRVYLRASIDRGLAARAAMGQVDDAVMPVIEHRIHRGVLDPEQSELIDDWVRHDIFTTIAAGADGFISFSGFPPDQGLADFARYNDAYTEVVAEVIEAGIPELYRFGVVDTSVSTEVLSGPAQLEIPVLFVPQRDNPTETYASVSVRVWEWQGQHRVVAVNHANEPVTISVSGGPGTLTIDLDALGTGVFEFETD